LIILVSRVLYKVSSPHTFRCVAHVLQKYDVLFVIGKQLR